MVLATVTELEREILVCSLVPLGTEQKRWSSHWNRWRQKDWSTCWYHLETDTVVYMLVPFRERPSGLHPGAAGQTPWSTS